MWSDQLFLQDCLQLSEVGYRPRFKPGMLIGRRFADLGFEVFHLLPGNKLLSLFTSHVTQLKPEEEVHFFHVLSTNEAVVSLLEKGFQIKELEFQDQREWRLSFSDSKLSFVATEIESVLLKALIKAYSLP